MKKHPSLLVALMLICLSASGCATPKLWKPSGSDVAPLRGQRREEALSRFDSHRDHAQYQAAMDRWRANDPFTCEAQLRGIVSRNPKHLEARQALADLTLDRGDTAAAEQELREILKVAPDDPQTHHSLGLLLQSLNREVEALPRLQKAAELAPDNTLYQLCVQPAPRLPAAPPIVAARENY
jgi:predicted Zn-dependent protease